MTSAPQQAEAYAILGIGCAPGDFAGQRWSADGAELVTVEWRDEHYGDEHWGHGWEHGWGNGRFVVVGAPDRAHAQDAADALVGLIDFFAGSLGFEVALLPIPADWAERGYVDVVDAEAVLNQDKLGFWKPGAVRAHASTTSDAVLKALSYVDLTMRHDESAPVHLYRAVQFLRASTADFTFLGDSVGEVLAEPDARPDSHADRTRLENSFHNAFKVIEALIGEPNRDENRRRRQLALIGVDPEQEIGLPGSEARNVERVQTLQNMRDRKSAHGRSSDKERILTYFDLMDAQFYANFLVMSALEHLAGQARSAVP